MDEIAIRRAAIGDIPHLIHHRRAMFADMGHTDPAVLDAMDGASQEYFAAALSNGTYQAWLAETSAGRVVSGGGIAIVHWPGSPDFPAARRGWILNIYTEPEFRHRGLARRIMQAIIDWCREERFAYVSLHASRFGRQLYENMGFKPTNEMRLYL
jgi:GNAT superfamily N-acetyltransferase